jgi:quercetin dioxygenase-like cupin family protein
VADKHRLADNFLHLGRGASAVPQPRFDGMQWYEDYGQRHGDDGAEGRLVSWHSFAESWDVWEMHPKGSEVVICIEGAITLIQEDSGGATRQVALEAGEYAINAPGVWHTADVASRATAIFVTAGEGTQHRPR